MRWRPRLSTSREGGLSSLAVRDFRRLYIALIGTSVSYQLQRTIELWLVYEITGSPLLTGFTGLVRGAATIVFALAGGVVADRIDRRRFVILTAYVNALITLSLGGVGAYRAHLGVAPLPRGLRELHPHHRGGAGAPPPWCPASCRGR